MSRGIGGVERAIVNYFSSAESKPCTDIEWLAHVAYVSPYFYVDEDWRPTRAQLVAVRRALKRLVKKDYPVRLFRIGKTRGQPMLALWTGNNRYWWRRGADTNVEQANRSQEALRRQNLTRHWRPC